MMMIDDVVQAYELVRELRKEPQMLRVFLNPIDWEDLVRSTSNPAVDPFQWDHDQRMRMHGVPVEVDPSVPFGSVEIRVRHWPASRSAP